ncbi:hypothetical protein QTN25_005931 [Entamoeba marina]
MSSVQHLDTLLKSKIELINDDTMKDSFLYLFPLFEHLLTIKMLNIMGVNDVQSATQFIISNNLPENVKDLIIKEYVISDELLSSYALFDDKNEITEEMLTTINSMNVKQLNFMLHHLKGRPIESKIIGMYEKKKFNEEIQKVIEKVFEATLLQHHIGILDKQLKDITKKVNKLQKKEKSTQKSLGDNTSKMDLNKNDQKPQPRTPRKLKTDTLDKSNTSPHDSDDKLNSPLKHRASKSHFWKPFSGSSTTINKDKTLQKQPSFDVPSTTKVTVQSPRSPRTTEIVSPRLVQESDLLRKSFRGNQQFSQLALALPKLSEWCEKKTSHIVFDSNIDGSSNSVLFEKISKKHDLYFVNFDSKGNIFGAYIKSDITTLDEWNYDENHFVFVVKSNNKTLPPTKWLMNVGCLGGVLIYDEDDRLYSVGNGNGFFTIWKTGLCECSCHELNETYEMESPQELNGTNYPTDQEKFSIDRIVIFQMR